MKNFIRLVVILIVSIISISCVRNTRDIKDLIKNQNSNINVDLFNGAWRHDENENAIFGVFGDSLYYPDSDMWYRYEIYSDSLFIIHNDGYIEKAQILELNNNILILNYFKYDLIDTLRKRK